MAEVNDLNLETLFRLQITFETETEIVDISNAITHFIILDDYTDSNLPALQTSIETSDEIVEFIMVNKAIGKFKMFLYKCDTRKILDKEDFVETPLIKNMELTLHTQAFSKDTYDTDSFGSEQKVDFNVRAMDLLFHPKFILEMNNPSHNFFIHNVDRMNLLSYLMSYSLKTDGIILGNSETYNIHIGDLQQMQMIPQLFIPNLNLFSILDYVDANYGLFKTQSVKYFGLFGAYIFEMKEAIGVLQVKDKTSIIKIVQESVENPVTDVSGNDEGILAQVTEIRVVDNTLSHQIEHGDEITLTSFNLNPDSKDARYELIKSVPTTMVDYRTGEEIKTFTTSNKKVFYDSTLRPTEHLKDKLSFNKNSYYELECMVKDFDFTLLHPLRDIKLLDTIDGIKNTDGYMISRVQTELDLDVELNNRIKGNDLSDVIFTPLSVFTKEDFATASIEPFYYRPRVFFNLIKVK